MKDIEDFFQQEDIYIKHKDTKKKPCNLYQKNSRAFYDSFALTQYAGALDANLFDIISTGKAQKNSVLQQKKKFLRKVSIFLLLVFCSAFVVYYAVSNMRHGLRAFEFAQEKSAFKALHDYAFPENESVISENSPAVIPDSFISVEYTNYTVEKGDTISGIAKKFGLRNIGTIFSANEISNARRIMSGEKLLIPSIDGIIYKVKKGDSLALIASKFEISMESILDANDLSRQSVYIGQTLFIPGASLPVFEIRKAMGELFIYPIKGRLTSPFGYRADPFTGRRSFHSGIDLAAPEGTPIKVVLDGKVNETGYSRIFGNYIIITHSGGYQSLYGHLSKFKVKRGQHVIQGSIIGLVGNTGMSTGPHVHLSIYKNGKLLNPLTVLK